MKTIQIPSGIDFSKPQDDCVPQNQPFNIYFLQGGTFTSLSGGSAFNPPICSMHVNAGSTIGPWLTPNTASTLTWDFNPENGGVITGAIDVAQYCAD